MTSIYICTHVYVTCTDKHTHLEVPEPFPTPAVQAVPQAGGPWALAKARKMPLDSLKHKP